MAVGPGGSQGTKTQRVVKARKCTRYTTPHNRNHRFQPFSERIAKLKIDPIRRKRNVEEHEQLNDITESYFARSLEGWRDLNLSQTFTAFTKEVVSLTDNLPMVLHNEDKIMDTLVMYLEKADPLAMEPLLNLMSQFAHDLDVRFYEKHFSRAVATVAAIAANHQDPAVIEWSFTCLAWLFKYLSRLLVPDLPRLYDLMSPYLGTKVQKPFVIRFAAESLSFLIRKAASLYDRDPDPLNQIVVHALGSVVNVTDNADVSLYEQGLMTLFTEAIKGIRDTLHSSGVTIVQCLLKSVHSLVGSAKARGITVVNGILTSIIHHTSTDTFLTIEKAVIQYLEDMLAAEDVDLGFAASVLFTITGVRKGNRITDWKRLMLVCGSILSYYSQTHTTDFDEYHSTIISLIAVTIQTAPVDAILPSLKYVEILRHRPFSKHFLKFCDISARLGISRFNTFVQPTLEKFGVENWSNLMEDLSLYLPRITARGVRIQISLSTEQWARFLALLADSLKQDLARSCKLLATLDCINIEALDSAHLCSILQNFIQLELQHDNQTNGLSLDFAVGVCLRTLMRLTEEATLLEALWVPLCEVSRKLTRLPKYWLNMSEILRRHCFMNVHDEAVTLLCNSAIQSLSLDSHEIRESSLYILQRICEARDIPAAKLLSVAITIESTQLSLDTSRSITMNFRKLSSGYGQASSSQLVNQAIPAFCFGAFHYMLAQARDDSMAALAEMSKTSVGEEVSARLSCEWIEGVTSSGDQESHTEFIIDAENGNFHAPSDFECTNLARLRAMLDQVFVEVDSGYLPAQALLENETRHVPSFAPGMRELSLRFLNKIPVLAEKKSRVLVPILLRWSGDVEGRDMGATDSDKHPARWTRKDQKLMLSLFAQFTNPKVLFHAQDVYHALLNLLGNGDVEIQQSALKALLAWKEPGVNRYEEHLNNLLDEGRFREEVSVFLQDDLAAAPIRSEDHEVLMPILLRILYGRAVAGGKQDQASRRKAIFVALSRFGPKCLGLFIDITMTKICRLSEELPTELHQVEIIASLRQQMGMLNMWRDLLLVLGSEVASHAPRLVFATTACAVAAANLIDGNAMAGTTQDVSLLRAIRQTALSCISLIFNNMDDCADLRPAAAVIKTKLIDPRLEKFNVENTESVSALLRLLSAWSRSPNAVMYFKDEQILHRLADLLSNAHTKDEVRLFILADILDHLTRLHSSTEIVQASITVFVQSITRILSQAPTKEVLDACVTTFTSLSQQVANTTEAEAIMLLCANLLVQPNKNVSPYTKYGLLRTIEPLVEKFTTVPDCKLSVALCGLFSRLTDTNARVLLSKVYTLTNEKDSTLSKSAHICAQLNAHSDRLDEPDHNERAKGFAAIAANATELTPEQWLSIVHNCMFFVRDANDLVNRSHASQALLWFMGAAERNPEAFKSLIAEVVLPGIEYGVREQSEIIRVEYLNLLGKLASSQPPWPGIGDLGILTVENDEEASVFNNILHIQQHRRLRALRRLAVDAESVHSSNITKFFLPLLEHFVFDQAPNDFGRALADQTVTTIGALTKSLTWQNFRATFKRYTGYISTKEDLEKTVLRLLAALVDALRVKTDGVDDKISVKITPPKQNAIVTEFLPPLMEYLHKKDESTVDRRMPVATTIVKLLLLLPEDELSTRLPPVLTDVSHVLRSRSQEARDQTRKTLAAIVGMIGPTYLNFVIKELRGALQRGYQLHVLSYTVHTLLVQILETCQPGDLDGSLSDLVNIVMDDIFGITGQEKDAEEYKSGMKEVKSSQSYDTMQILARATPIRRLGQLIQPLRALLGEKLDSKTVKKADELLTRFRKGVEQNPAADSRDMLSFCHELVRQVYADKANAVRETVVEDYKIRKYIIQMEAANKSKSRAATTSQISKLSTFALNLMRTIVRRHPDLQSPANMAGFLPIIGDALVQGQEDFKLAAIRTLATIIRTPLPEIETNSPVYLKEAVALIKSSANIKSDASQAALELVTAILRDRSTVKAREVDIAVVLSAVKSDIDEPDRQGMVYRFIRAVLGRKIIVVEVYDLMDEVAKAMVVNADRNIRESARSAYVQFVLYYPQSKDRWNQQASFLVSNLKYEHASGRQSVMEAMHQILNKIGDENLAQIAFTFLVALVPVQVSDTDEECQQMAGILLAKLLETASPEQLKTFLALMDKWLVQDDKPAIQRAAYRCWTIYLRTQPIPRFRQEKLRDEIHRVLTSADVQVGEILLREILNTLTTMVEVCPEVVFAKAASSIWSAVKDCGSIPDIDIADMASSLIGSYFTHLASSAAKSSRSLAAVPLVGSGGLKLGDEEMRKYCSTFLQILKTSTTATKETTITFTIRNLLFLGRCFAANGILWKVQDDDEDIDDVNDDIDNDESMPGTDSKYRSSAIEFLFNRLSYLVRQEHLPIVVRSAAIQCETALISSMKKIPSLSVVVRSLYLLTDPLIPQAETEDRRALQDKARELLEKLRKAIGPADYLAALGEARKAVSAKREERRQKRRIAAVSEPEKWAESKKRKHEAQRLKKKEKGMEARGRRRGW